MTSESSTMSSGLAAVIWTDFVQTILMLIGAFILMGMAMYEVSCGLF